MDGYVDQGPTERGPRVTVATKGLPHIGVVTDDSQLFYLQNYTTSYQGAPTYFTTPLTPSGPSQNQWLSPSSSLSHSSWSPASSSTSLHGSPENNLFPLPPFPLANSPTDLALALTGLNPFNYEAGNMFQTSPGSFHFPSNPIETVPSTHTHAYISNIIPLDHRIRELDEPERLAVGKEYQCVPCNVMFVSLANAMRHCKKDRRIYQCAKCFKTYSRNDYKKCHEKRCHRQT